jgi:L-fuconolactonase
MYIDSHVHVWELIRDDYGWIKPDNELLYRDYKPGDLEPHLTANAVNKVILVQAAPTIAETRYMLGLADQYPFIAGVVGTLDWNADTFHEDYQSLCEHKGFVGVRVNGGSLRGSEPGWLDKLRQYASDGYPLDLLVVPTHLPDVIWLMEQLPGLRVVINHLGCPLAKDTDESAWRRDMDHLSSYAGVHVKVSGMITQANGYHPERLKPYVEHLIRAFGSERLLFGSDWPVALRGGSYTEVVKLFEQVLPDTLTDVQKNQIRYGNATIVYRLGGEA